MRKMTILAPLYFFVFATGAAGLIYQVTWQKYLGRLFGSDNVATAIILATFLGGLSFGYYLCGRLTIRVKNHFKAYAFLEAIIALWCLCFPYIFSLVDYMTRGWSFAPPILIIVQAFSCSVLLMGIPTICMGGTIPFLTRGISRNVVEATNVHARVYGINTAGAFLGTLLAGFFLIPAFGMPLTVMGTAALNIGAFLFFYLLSVRKKEPGLPGAASGGEPVVAGAQTRPETAAAAPAAGDVLPSPRFPKCVLYTIAFLSGFYVMALENVLIRITNLSLGSSSYSFSMIVSVFVLSIAIGSYAVSRLKRLPRSALFINQLSITAALLLLYLSLDAWPYWAHVTRITFQSNMIGFWAFYGCLFVVLTLILILPVSLMGATVPIAFHELKEDLKNVGKDSGTLFSWNTIGSLTGSLLGGIVFFYLIDNPAVFSSAILLAAVSTCLAAWPLRKKYLSAGLATAAIAIVLLIFTPFYNVKHFVLGTFRQRQALPYSLGGPNAFFEKFSAELQMKFYKDGPACSVAVIGSKKHPLFEHESISVIVNGKSDSSTVFDAYTLKLSAHLPALLARSREKVLVIGLGTGVTAGELSLYPDVKEIDIAEISPTVVEVLPYFHTATHNIHKDPRVRIHIADAFRILRRSSKKWDIIISEPPNPWVTGVDQLFTKEFYQLVNQHLTEDGVFLQWAQIYSISPRLVGMIANTVAQEFTQSNVFMADSKDLLIAASGKPLTAGHIKNAEKTLAANQKVRASLEEINIKSIDAILLRQIWTTSCIADYFQDFGIQTMDNPRLHYLAGKRFFMGESVKNEFLFGPGPAMYFHEFLLAKKYTGWQDHGFSMEELEPLLLSTRNILTGDFLPAINALKLKAWMSNAEMFPLTEVEKRSVKAELILLITGKKNEAKDWAAAGLEGASYRKKAQAMMNHISGLRNWVVPFPIDGFKAVLGRGAEGGRDAYEKNWCALHLALILVQEKTDKKLIRQILAGTVKGSDGEVILKDEDKWLLESIRMRFAGY